MIGDLGSNGATHGQAAATGVGVLRWADRGQRTLICTAHDPTISFKYQRFGFRKIGTTHSRIFGVGDVLVRLPRTPSSNNTSSTTTPPPTP